MIKVDNLNKVFNPRSRNRNQVLKNVSFELPDKGLVAIFGKSGSGKTTLLNIMGGLDTQDSGSVYIAEENIKGKTDKIRNANIGYIFQNYYLERGYTITEILRNQMIIAGFKDEYEITRRSQQVLELVEMERYKKKQGDALSGGQMQRVAIARAIIKGSDIILADEPTGNLDAQNTIKVMDILKAISKTKLVVLVTHEISLIKNYADSYIEILDGEINSESRIFDVYDYDTEINNIYVDEEQNRAFKDGALDIAVYGEPSTVVEKITIIHDKGELYIKAGKNVTVLEDSGEKRIVFRDKKQKSSDVSEQKALVAPDFTKSTSNKNGKLFNFRGILQILGRKGGEGLYNTSNVFKQIFIAAMAVIVCFFSFNLFNALNITQQNKTTGANSIYTELNAYSDLRRVNETVYDDIDFFQTKLKQGSFSYDNLASLSGIKAYYAPKPLYDKSPVELSGKMPAEGEVLVSRALAEDLKGKQRLSELKTDKAVMSMLFEQEYPISGIIAGDEPAVYLNKSDYVNFLGVYKAISFKDNNAVFFSAEFVKGTFSAEIRELKSDMQATDSQAIIEINRNSLYKMMHDITQADNKVTEANETLVSRTTDVYFADSKPLYVRQFRITRENVSSDMIIYVSEKVLDNIFIYLSPNIDALRMNVSGAVQKPEYYFEINADSEERLNTLSAKLSERGIHSVDIKQIYENEYTEAVDSALKNLTIFLAAIVLIYLIYYFIEKSASIKNSKEYGVFRAIGVNKSNLLFKEAVTAFMGNILPYIVFYISTSALMAVYLSFMALSAVSFIALALYSFLISAALMAGISLIPYLFVLYQTPAKILSKYDI